MLVTNYTPDEFAERAREFLSREDGNALLEKSIAAKQPIAAIIDKALSAYNESLLMEEKEPLKGIPDEEEGTKFAKEDIYSAIVYYLNKN